MTFHPLNSPPAPSGARSRRPRRCLKCDRLISGGYLCERCRKENARIDESFVNRGVVRIGRGDE